MPLNGLRRATLPALALLVAPMSMARAQGGGREGSEFVRQSILVTNFVPADSLDRRLGRAAGDAVRSKVGKVASGRELSVAGGTPMRDAMRATGYEENQIFAPSETRAIARHLRADEFLVGAVRNTPEGPRLSAWLMLTRDPRLRQPLPAVVGREMDLSAEKLASQLVAARTQLAPLRRCENALRAGRPEQAAAFAREAIEAYPRAAMGRVCLLWALRASPSGTARQVLDVARELLAIDSANAHGLESAAIALDSLHESGEAGAHWLRLAQTDSTDVELSERVFEALMLDGNTVRAESLVTPLAAMYPAESPLRWQWFRSAFANRSWKRAVRAGENLLARDSSARGDSVMQRQLAVAYASNGQPVQAIETLARGVRTFPGDGRIYALYAQYVRAESDTVIPRGLSIFPRSADLLALDAKELRARGKLQESLAATRRAADLDSAAGSTLLLAAQLELELGRPDSALATLHAALKTGQDSSTIAQFALSRGNAMYRAASGTRTSGDFSLALRFIGLADSLRHSPQSRFLTGVAALGVAQTALSEAAALASTRLPESCRLARLGESVVPLARMGLTEGMNVQPDAAQQSLAYVAQLEPYVTRSLSAYCVRAPL